MTNPAFDPSTVRVEHVFDFPPMTGHEFVMLPDDHRLARNADGSLDTEPGCICGRAPLAEVMECPRHTPWHFGSV